MKKDILAGLFWAPNILDAKHIYFEKPNQFTFTSLSFGFAKTSLGWYLAAFSQAGLCWFEPLEKPVLTRSFQEYFAGLDRTHDDYQVNQKLQQASERAFMPLHLTGTSFQLSVWRELLHTLAGEVLSYAELGQRIARPQAARAVGSAVGANRIALFVPCHRVLPASGGVGGYRWGADLKARVLQIESEFVSRHNKAA
ncbi:MAG: methylated-DNA--[protein]-cysteine S-methyltransferase [Gammaproteobacteria bacterium]